MSKTKHTTHQAGATDGLRTIPGCTFTPGAAKATVKVVTK